MFERRIYQIFNIYKNCEENIITALKNEEIDLLKDLYESVIKKLESIKADELMLESIKNKEIYYQDFNYNILKQK